MAKPSDVDNFTPLYVGVTQDVGLAAGAVYGRMFRYAQKSGICQASNQTIATELGISVRTVIRTQQVLIGKGYIIDKTPDLRNRPHTYTMTSKAAAMSKCHTDAVPECHTDDSSVPECHSSVPECHSECDKMSLEERKKRESKREKTTPIGGSQEFQSDVEMFYNGDVPETPSGNGEKPHMEPLDPLTHIAEQARRRDAGEIDWLLPGTPCGDHDYLEPLRVFCGVIRRGIGSLGEPMARDWLRELEHIATKENISMPHLMAEAIKAIRDDWNFQNDRWRTPHSKALGEQIGLAAARIASGELVAGNGWSGAMT